MHDMFTSLDFTSLDELSNTLNQLFNIGCVYISERATSFMEKIRKLDAQTATMNVLMYCSRGMETAKKKYNQLYQTNKQFKFAIDNVLYAFSFGKATVQMRKHEPIYEDWYSVSTLWKSFCDFKTHVYHYNDYYEPLITGPFSERFQNLYKDACFVYTKENALVDGVVTFKMNGKYVHRVCKQTPVEDNDNIRLDYSDVKFLSIECCNETIKEPIILELNKNDYLVNNEILSSGFVARALKYQIPYSAYCENYKLKIMDNDLKTFEIDARQYIVLNKTDYSVMNKE